MYEGTFYEQTEIKQEPGGKKYNKTVSEWAGKGTLHIAGRGPQKIIHLKKIHILLKSRTGKGENINNNLLGS